MMRLCLWKQRAETRDTDPNYFALAVYLLLFGKGRWEEGLWGRGGKTLMLM